MQRIVREVTSARDQKSKVHRMKGMRVGYSDGDSEWCGLPLSAFLALTHQFDRWKDGSAKAKAKAGPSKRAALPIKVDEESEDEGEITPAQLKGKVHTVLKKTSSKLEARKTRDMLAHHLNHLHSWLFQIWVKVKELEVEYGVLMSEVSEIVEALEDMDL